MLDEKQKEQIQDYLSGNLSKKEEEAFWSDVNSSKEMDEQLRFQKDMLGHIQAMGREQLKQNLLQQFGIRNPKPNRNRAFSKRFWWYSSAAMIILFVISYGLRSVVFQENETELFEQYFRPYQLISVRSSTNLNYLNAIEKYRAGDYSKALETLLSSKSYPIEDEKFLLVANCHLVLDNPREALIWLDKISSSEYIYRSYKDWYTALVFLRINEISSAEEILQQISLRKGILSEEASDLLKEPIFR